MTRRRVEDYPDHIQKQIKAQLPGVKSLASTARRPSYVPGKMNQTEAECLRLHIQPAHLPYDDHPIEFEGERIELADHCSYLPDFVVRSMSGEPIEYWEVKGPYVREDSRQKFLHAVRARRGAVFVWARKRRNGEWQIERWTMRGGMPRKMNEDAK